MGLAGVNHLAGRIIPRTNLDEFFVICFNLDDSGTGVFIVSDFQISRHGQALLA